MAKRITDDVIKKINEEYLINPIKSQVAKKLGISAATVSKYLIPNYTSQKQDDNYEKIVLPQKTSLKLSDDFGKLCKLTEKEKREAERL